MAVKTVLKGQDAAGDRSRRAAACAPWPAISRIREAGETDRLIYERVRLGILSALSVNPSMTFAELKELLQTTDGNLSIHARKLEDAGYVACKKRFAARVPKTEFSLTAKGKRMFARHLEHMEALIHAAKGT